MIPDIRRFPTPDDFLIKIVVIYRLLVMPGPYDLYYFLFRSIKPESTPNEIYHIEGGVLIRRLSNR